MSSGWFRRSQKNQIRLFPFLQNIPQYIEVPLNIEAKESFHTFLLFSLNKSNPLLLKDDFNLLIPFGYWQTICFYPFKILVITRMKVFSEKRLELFHRKHFAGIAANCSGKGEDPDIPGTLFRHKISIIFVYEREVIIMNQQTPDHGWQQLQAHIEGFLGRVLRNDAQRIEYKPRYIVRLLEMPSEGHQSECQEISMWRE